MGRELQKKKNRSSLNRVTRRSQNKRKTIIKGSELVRANWDKKETMAQNYARLGLTQRMSQQTGGVEVTGKYTPTPAPSLNAAKQAEAVIHRGEDGEVTHVTINEPLSLDALDDYKPSPTNGRTTDIIRKMEERAAMAVPQERTQSEGEKDWIERLVEKHGDDYDAMFWDKSLNVMQQSVGDLKRRVKKWKETQAKKSKSKSKAKVANAA